MARWRAGEAEVEGLVDSGDLQALTGGAANGKALLLRAARTVATARTAIETDPDSAFVLAYDGARQALTGLLAQQGLRPTTKGGHYAVERAARAQFGAGFRQFGALRRRRNELEYPQRPGDFCTVEEADAAVDAAEAVVAAAETLVEQVGLFSAGHGRKL